MVRLIDAEPMPCGELWESLSNNEKLNVLLYLLQMPTVAAEPVRRGQWNEPTGRFQDGFWVCSSCNFCSEATAAPILYKFCPNCGAKMDLEEDTND